MKEDPKKETLRRLDVIRSKFQYRWEEMSSFARENDIEWIKKALYGEN